MALEKIMYNLVKTLPKTVGSAGKMTLTSNQIRLMGDNGRKVAEVMERVGADSLDVAYKAKSNYSIAGIKLKNGNDVVGNGAISIQNPGARNTVLKYRASVGENGEILTSNGFFDAGKSAPIDDFAVSASRRGGHISQHTEVGNAAALHLEADEKGVLNILKKLPNGEGIMSKYSKMHYTMQQKLDQAYQSVGRFLKGQAYYPVTDKISLGA